MAGQVDGKGAVKPRRPGKREQPAIGWVLISRSEVDKAAQLLQGGEKGVVDELGVLAIHQAISDRLFPGTSVLHTRLRYALFVPWMMQMAAGKPDPLGQLASHEFDLAGQLLKTAGKKDVDSSGIIGGLVHAQNKHAAQPPSYSYWSALVAWGILGRDYERATPSRESILQELAEGASRGMAVDTDGQLLGTGQPLFVGLPPPPDDFLENPKGLTFALPAKERSYLRSRLSAVKAPATGGSAKRESFLASLAREKVVFADARYFWDDPQACSRVPAQDRHLIGPMRDVSALCGIARALYLALVERKCDEHGLTVHRKHRDHLEDCRSRWGVEAVRADLPLIIDNGLGLQRGSQLHHLLGETQKWVRSPTRKPGQALEEVYTKLERSRKAGRSRLSGDQGASVQLRRWAHFSAKSATADRLHFRWSQVRDLMGDLHG